jgi:hypothetical protein
LLVLLRHRHEEDRYVIAAVEVWVEGHRCDFSAVVDVARDKDMQAGRLCQVGVEITPFRQ